MGNFIKVSMANPSDVEFINIDSIIGIAKGKDGHAKIYMADGNQYETYCSYSEFLQILNLSASEL